MCFLREVEGHVGVAQKRVRVRAVLREDGDSDARVDLEVDTHHGARPRECLPEPVGELESALCIGARGDDGELVTAESGDGVDSRGRPQTA